MRISAADYFARLSFPHPQHPRRSRTRPRGSAAREKTNETPYECPNAHGGFMSQNRANPHQQTERSPDERLFFSHLRFTSSFYAETIIYYEASSLRAIHETVRISAIAR
jgi:hypothetical protein